MSNEAYASPLSVATTNSVGFARPGDIRGDANGNEYRMVYLVASASYGHVLQFNTDSVSYGYAALKVSDSNARPVGILNQWGTAQSYTSGYYAWAQCHGTGIASCAASSYSAGVWLCPSTNGALQSYDYLAVDHDGSFASAIASFRTAAASLQTVWINMR